MLRHEHPTCCASATHNDYLVSISAGVVEAKPAAIEDGSVSGSSVVYFGDRSDNNERARTGETNLLCWGR